VTPIEQAGGIAYRMRSDGVWILLVRAKKDPSVWIFPKGHIERGESAAAAALRETKEEAGIEGELVGPVGEPLEFQSGQEIVRVQYFLIRAGSEVPSKERRPKQWFPFDQAIDQLRFPDARRLLSGARLAIEKHR
jgi:8-oxo-dGTP pyrophosphatase MutT (NUDIX family)